MSVHQTQTHKPARGKLELDELYQQFTFGSETSKVIQRLQGETQGGSLRTPEGWKACKSMIGLAVSLQRY
jgi:hypothetical protein